MVAAPSAPALCFAATGPLPTALRRHDAPRTPLPSRGVTLPRRTRPRRAAVTGCAAAPGPPVLAPNADHYEQALSHPVVHRYDAEDGASYALWYTADTSSADAPAVTAGSPTAGRASAQTLTKTERSICLAISTNGASFARVAGPLAGSAVLRPNAEDWWAFDTQALASGSVVVSSATRVRSEAAAFYLYYHAHCAERVADADAASADAVPLSRIGVAVSKDGEHFSRVEGDAPSGAVLEPAEPPAFDSGTLSRPSVLLLATAPAVAAKPKATGLSALLANPSSRGGDDVPAARRGAAGAMQYVMHYTGAPADGDGVPAIGRAVSSDGLSFRRAPAGAPVVPVPGETRVPEWRARGVCGPSVVQRESGVSGGAAPFVMFVEAIGADGVHRLAACESVDCATWGPLQLVLQPGREGSWDDAGVSQPCAVDDGRGGLMLFYVGSGSADPGTSAIGVATSDGLDWTSLRRMERPAGTAELQ